MQLAEMFSMFEQDTASTSGVVQNQNLGIRCSAFGQAKWEADRLSQMESSGFLHDVRGIKYLKTR